MKTLVATRVWAWKVAENEIGLLLVKVLLTSLSLLVRVSCSKSIALPSDWLGIAASKINYKAFISFFKLAS